MTLTFDLFCLKMKCLNHMREGNISIKNLKFVLAAPVSRFIRGPELDGETDGQLHFVIRPYVEGRIKGNHTPRALLNVKSQAILLCKAKATRRMY